jgi:hypothetical protein
VGILDSRRPIPQEELRSQKLRVATSFHDLLTRAFDEGASSNNIVQMGLAHQTHIAQPSATVT